MSKDVQDLAPGMDVIAIDEGRELVKAWIELDTKSGSVPVQTLDFAREHCIKCKTHEQAVEHIKILCHLNRAGQGQAPTGETVPNGMAKFFSEMKKYDGPWWLEESGSIGDIRTAMREADKQKREEERAEKQRKEKEEQEEEMRREAAKIVIDPEVIQFLVDRGLTTVAALEAALAK